MPGLQKILSFWPEVVMLGMSLFIITRSHGGDAYLLCFTTVIYFSGYGIAKVKEDRADVTYNVAAKHRDFMQLWEKPGGATAREIDDVLDRWEHTIRPEDYRAEVYAEMMTERAARKVRQNRRKLRVIDGEKKNA